MEATIDQKTDLINKYRINPLADVSEPPTYCTINNRPSLTAGNFSLIYGKKKAGKTFLLGGVIASTINNSTQLEVIKGCLPEDKNVVLYFDTEQSQYHANRSIKRICKLIGNSDPKNLFAYGLRPLAPFERLSVIEAAINMTPNIGMVAIDGIRDLLTTGINDEQAATQLTSLFLKWSYDLNLHIVLLLHQNKGDEHARGHIGSEVVNKAETTISVTKEVNNNLFKVVCEDSRDIPFDEFGFTITEDGLPMAADILETKQRKIADPNLISSETHLDELHNIYCSKLEYTYNELRTTIMNKFNIGRDASEKFISYYKSKTWILIEKRGKSTYHKLNNNVTSFFYNPNNN
jgi:hypothetical protein